MRVSEPEVRGWGVPVLRGTECFIELACCGDQPRPQQWTHRSEPVAIEEIVVHLRHLGTDSLQLEWGQVPVPT